MWWKSNMPRRMVAILAYVMLLAALALAVELGNEWIFPALGLPWLFVAAWAESGGDRRLKARQLPPGLPVGRDGPQAQDPALAAEIADARRPLAALAFKGRVVGSVGFSPDGRLLAAGADGAVALWDLSDPAHPRHTATLEPEHTEGALALHPGGRLLAAGGKDAVLLWDIADPAHPAPAGAVPCPHAVHAVAFSPDGRLLAAAASKTVLLWDIAFPAHPSLIRTVSHRGVVAALAFDPNGRTLAAVGSGKQAAVLWDLAALSTDRADAHPVALSPRPPDRALTSSPARVNAVAFSPDGRLLATASGEINIISDEYSSITQKDGAVIVWDLGDPAHPAHLCTLAERGGTRTNSKHSRRNRTVPAFTGHSDTPRALAFTPHGRTLASGGDDTTVLLWDLTDPTHPRHTATLPHHAPVLAVAFNPDGNLIATTAQSTITLWTTP